jgi:hypothetical protein
VKLDIDVTGAVPVTAGDPGWAPPLERLRSETKAARDNGKHDPWTEVEAECWIDLIDAELSAQRSAPASGSRQATISRLRHWRAELQLLVRQLQAIERVAPPARPRFPQSPEKFCA